jgi:hypothetical protein
MKTAHSSTAQLTPERYTADLAGELRGRGNNDLPVISRTSHHKKAQAPLSGGEPPPSHQQAYTLWRQGHGLLDICIRMRGPANPQSETVVMCVRVISSRRGVFAKLGNHINCSSYILRALNEDPTLPFSLEDLISLVRLDSSSWIYHRDTIERWAQEGRAALT